MIISFEGIEGVGKSTQINLLKDWFEKRNLKTIILREPGSTKASEKIRDILLSNDISLANETELLLMFSARAQLINEKIVNSKYDIILFDRYYDASIAYQGYGRGLSKDFIYNLIEFTKCPIPKITFLLDLDVEDGFKRKSNDKKDRIELSGLDFFNKVRNGYLNIASNDPDRVKVINANQSQPLIHNQIISSIELLL
ncbi:dTMP kinase [Gammaproteobacteria bacterium]|nr:dTMP kinase [Gammaproteobacteria bacterium]